MHQSEIKILKHQHIKILKYQNIKLLKANQCADGAHGAPSVYKLPTKGGGRSENHNYISIADWVIERKQFDILISDNNISELMSEFQDSGLRSFWMWIDLLICHNVGERSTSTSSRSWYCCRRPVHLVKQLLLVLKCKWKRERPSGEGANY